MNKLILTLIICLFTTLAFAQDKPKEEPVKQDTIIAVKMDIKQFRYLLMVIDQNVDSKKASKELLDFLQSSALILQPADKPKK